MNEFQVVDRVLGVLMRFRRRLADKLVFHSSCMVGSWGKVADYGVTVAAWQMRRGDGLYGLAKGLVGSYSVHLNYSRVVKYIERCPSRAPPCLEL